jgi:uncharacterized membrane protein YgdD (TMEM256/DUF423 family)
VDPRYSPAAALGALAVTLGAFGAHGLKELLAQILDEHIAKKLV